MNGTRIYKIYFGQMFWYPKPIPTDHIPLNKNKTKVKYIVVGNI